MLRLLIADDHPLFRRALRGMLRVPFSDSVLLEADSLATALGRLDDTLDLVLLDLSMPDCSGFDALLQMRAKAPSVPVVIVSAHADIATVRQASTMGAAGFIPKTSEPDEILRAVGLVLDGQPCWPAVAPAEPEPEDDRLARLSKGELRVLQLITEGKSNKQIAYELDIKETTVKSHVTALLRKLDVQSRTQVVLLAKSLRP